MYQKRTNRCVMLDLQKASVWKRISAGITDFIAMCILTVGLAFLLAFAVGYDGHATKLNNLTEQYETQYKVNFSIIPADYDKLSDVDKAKFASNYAEAYEDALEAFNKDEDVRDVTVMIFSLVFLIATLSVFISHLILEFFIPRFAWGNGQTIGKKVFGICLMHPEGVKITTLQLFVRSILGKYTVETMIPISLVIMIVFGLMGIVGTIFIILLLVAQCIIFGVTQTNSLIHDILAHTVVVDKNSQMIFNTMDELITYKKDLAAEQTKSKTY